MKGYRF
jgi:hypothetical protein